MTEKKFQRVMSYALADSLEPDGHRSAAANYHYASVIAAKLAVSQPERSEYWNFEVERAWRLREEQELLAYQARFTQ